MWTTLDSPPKADREPVTLTTLHRRAGVNAVLPTRTEQYVRAGNLYPPWAETELILFLLSLVVASGFEPLTPAM
jgi:hypothetical protein